MRYSSLDRFNTMSLNESKKGSSKQELNSGLLFGNRSGRGQIESRIGLPFHSKDNNQSSYFNSET